MTPSVLCRIGCPLVTLLTFCLIGCPPADYTQAGPHPPAQITFTLTDGTRDRELVTTVWYPAVKTARDAADSGEPVENLVPEGPRRDTYADLLAAAPATCPSRRTHAANGADPKGQLGSIPLVVFSHCLECTRFGSFSLAENLASHGIAVAAVDHPRNTLFDMLEGSSDGLGESVLAERVSDQRFLLDQLLDPANPAVPELIRGRFDPEHLGAFGHSFGSVTTGSLLMDEDRLLAGAGLFAPFEFLPGVDMDAIDVPLLFTVAVEDNSISEFGNELIRDDYTEARADAIKAEVVDAGHFSFSDICAIHPNYTECCGEDIRQTDTQQTFTYLPIARGLAIGQELTARFFARWLLDDEKALDGIENIDGAQVRQRHP